MAMEELGKISKSKDVSFEIKAKVIYTLMLPVAMYGCESWTVEKNDKEKKKRFSSNMVLEENSTKTLDHRKISKWVLEKIKPETSLEAKMISFKSVVGSYTLHSGCDSTQ